MISNCILAQEQTLPDFLHRYRFSMGLGGIFTTAASLALFGGLSTLGWGLGFLVVGLAALNLFAGFCAGCFVYYQLNKLGVPYFSHAPLK